MFYSAKRKIIIKENFVVLTNRFTDKLQIIKLVIKLLKVIRKADN